jgi:iron complex transport system substrate-binding protein
MLADPDQVASVSHLAQDEANSFVAAQAKTHAINHARLEEIIAYQPDLVLTVPHTNPRLLNTLRQLGYQIHPLTLEPKLKTIIQDIRQLSTRLGQKKRGERLIHNLRQRLARMAPPHTRQPTAVFFQPRGYTSGSETLQDQAMKLAGWRNLAAEQGVQGYVPISLEKLISWRPDTLFTSPFSTARSSRAERLLEHPVLQRLLGSQPLQTIPYKYWICPGPMLADAVTRLRQLKLELKQP